MHSTKKFWASMKPYCYSFAVSFFLVVSHIALASTTVRAQPAPVRQADEGVPFNVVVYDAEHHVPLELARVALYRGSTFVIGKVTNYAGRAQFRDLVEGRYVLR